MTLVLSLVILLLVVGGMSIGVVMGRKPISGSCGGLNAVGINGDCEICGGNPNKCENIQDEQTSKPSDTSLAKNVGDSKLNKE